MDKYIYVFNCCGQVDLTRAYKLYIEAQKNIPNLILNKYCCLFKSHDGTIRSRSGSVKNIEVNFTKYLNQFGETFSLDDLFVTPKLKDTATWKEINESGPDFRICTEKNTFNIYLVTLNPLSECQVVDIWTNYSAIVSLNYMVSYSMDSAKTAQFTMLGHLCYPAYLTMQEHEQYYSKSEREIIDLLYDLRIYEICELKDVFPLCIATEKVTIDERGYVSKKKIDNKTFLYSKN